MVKSAFTDGFFPTMSNHKGALKRAVEIVNSIIKEVSGTKLLPKTVSADLMDCVYFCHLLKTKHCCLCLNKNMTPFWLPILLHHPPLPPTSTSSHPPILLNMSLMIPYTGKHPLEKLSRFEWKIAIHSKTFTVTVL